MLKRASLSNQLFDQQEQHWFDAELCKKVYINPKLKNTGILPGPQNGHFRAEAAKISGAPWPVPMIRR